MEIALILVESVLRFTTDWKGLRRIVMLNKRTAALVLDTDFLCGCVLPC